MTVPINVLLMFVVGYVSAMAASTRQLGGRVPYDLYLLISVVFMAVFFAPPVLFAQEFYGAWNFLYLVDPETLPLMGAHPLIVSALLVLVYFGILISGHFLARHAIDTNMIVFLPVPLGLSVIGVFLVVFFGYARLSRLGTLDDFIRGAAVPLSETSLVFAVSLGVLFLIAYLLALTFAWRRQTGDARR